MKFSYYLTCHLQVFLWEGCWELQSSFKHYVVSCDGACGESCHRNQACYNHKDKYEDGNLKSTLVLTAAKKSFIFTLARQGSGQMMGFPAWIQRFVVRAEQESMSQVRDSVLKGKLVCV